MVFAVTAGCGAFLGQRAVRMAAGRLGFFRRGTSDFARGDPSHGFSLVALRLFTPHAQSAAGRAHFLWGCAFLFRLCALYRRRVVGTRSLMGAVSASAFLPRFVGWAHPADHAAVGPAAGDFDGWDTSGHRPVCDEPRVFIRRHSYRLRPVLGYVVGFDDCIDLSTLRSFVGGAEVASIQGKTLGI